MKEQIKTLISEQDVAARINELAHKISNDFNGRTLTVICILKGSVVFTVDLIRKLTVPVELDFMDISSYGSGTESTGVIKIIMDLENSITGKDVLLVEDIIDSGRTLSTIYKHLQSQNPRSLEICTLLDKPDRRVVHDVSPKYVGFVIPDRFAIGFGLDYDQKYRNLPFVGELEFIEE